MLTLYELKELLGEDIISKCQDTPRWRALVQSDAEIVTDVAIDKDTLLKVYDNGFVLYETELHHTVFSIGEALADYTYESVYSESCGKRNNVIPLSVFYDMPWVFRVLIEAEDRVVHNLYTSPAVERCISLTSVMEQVRILKDDTNDTLDVILWKELVAVLKQSEHALTEYQRYLLNAVFEEERSIKDLSEEFETSRQAIEDVISRGLINIRKVFRDMGFEIESSLLKYK